MKRKCNTKIFLIHFSSCDVAMKNSGFCIENIPRSPDVDNVTVTLCNVREISKS